MFFGAVVDDLQLSPALTLTEDQSALHALSRAYQLVP